MSDQLHIHPLHDLIEHELSEACVCGPAAKLVETEHGDEWMMIHNSLDGREGEEGRSA